MFFSNMLRILHSGVRHSRYGGLLHRLSPRTQYLPPPPTRTQYLPPPPPPRREPNELPDIEAFTMSNVGHETTGLPMIVYVSTKNARHGCRIKVSQKYVDTINSGYWFSITVEDEPSVIGKTGGIKSDDVLLVKRWIALNKHVLLSYWRQELLTTHMLRSLKKI